MTGTSDQILAYALGQLDPRETQELEQALSRDPDLQRQLQQHLDALESLLDDLDVDNVTVPAGAEDQLLARLHPEHASPAPAQPSLSPPAAAPRALPWGVPALLAAAAALALAFVLRPAENLPERYAAVPGAVTQAITSPQEGALGQLVRLPDGRVFVHLNREAAAGRTYQLWQIRGETPESLGVFGAGGVLTSALPAGATLAVSVEPPGGSPQPTTTPLFVQGI